jgi:hypothetical protein
LDDIAAGADLEGIDAGEGDGHGDLGGGGAVVRCLCVPSMGTVLKGFKSPV